VPASVEIKDLRIIRDEKLIIPDLTLSLTSGVITGLLGPSGSGKTTIFRSIVGVQKLTSGSISVLGEPAGSKSLRNRIGYLPQSASVYNDLTCLENLHFFASILRKTKNDVAEVLDVVGLTDNRKQLASSLSGGERTRLGLASTLLGNPDILILDEPTVGLDPVLRIELWKIFHGLADRGKTLIISSHVMDEADRCQNLVLLRDGKTLAEGTPQELRTSTGATDMEGAFVALVNSK
jgi:ABC-2 type transport system ATP-binding protein